nr:DegV family protein [Coriobacterium glomerans]
MMNPPAAVARPDRCRIVIDTCADLTPEIAAALDVDILGFPYILDGKEFIDDIWSTMTPEAFYDRLRAGTPASTSAVSLGRYLEFLTECAREGTPTVYLCFTSALSSSYDAACRAAQDVREAYPDFELYIVDNGLPCAAGELLALEAVRQRDAGLSARELARWAQEAKFYVHGYFTLDSLQALAAGGRIPPAAAQLSSKLDVKANLTFDRTGSLSLTGVSRGRKKALRSLIKMFRENYVLDPTMPIAIASADAERDADWVESAVRKEEGCEDLTIIRGAVGPTIGAHVGPGMVALVFWGRNRADKISLTDRIARRVREAEGVRARS